MGSVAKVAHWAWWHYSNLAGEEDAKPARLAWLNEFDWQAKPC